MPPRLLPAWCGVLLAAGTLSAQSVELTVREEISGAVVAGAIVRLLGDAGVADRGLTDEHGHVTLRATAADLGRVP